MQFTILILYCMTALILAQDKYESLNNFKVEDLLKNERLLLGYARCLLDKGPCTPEVRRVKDTIPEALATRCAKCTDQQKEIGKSLAREVKRTHPKLWNELITKYDPAGQYQEAFQDYLKP